MDATKRIMIKYFIIPILFIVCRIGTYYDVNKKYDELLMVVDSVTGYTFDDTSYHIEYLEYGPFKISTNITGNNKVLNLTRNLQYKRKLILNSYNYESSGRMAAIDCPLDKCDLCEDNNCIYIGSPTCYRTDAIYSHVVPYSITCSYM